LVLGILVGLRYGILAAIFTGLFFGLILFFLLSRHFMGKLQEIQARSLKVLEAQKFDLAIKTLEEGMRYERWMLLVKSQVKGQVGYIHYLRKEFDRALPQLQEAFVKNWIAQGMLGACHFRRKEYDKMEAVMERAVKSNPKYPVLWGVFAYFEDELGKSDKALSVLSRGVEMNPGDEALKANLLSLQNKTRLNMRKFGDIWYQFHFELPPNKMRQAPQPFPTQMRRR